jgi:hypothetical protein
MPIDPKLIPKAQLLKIISIAINKEIEELLKEVELRTFRIKKLFAEIKTL